MITYLNFHFDMETTPRFLRGSRKDSTLRVIIYLLRLPSSPRKNKTPAKRNKLNKIVMWISLENIQYIVPKWRFQRHPTASFPACQYIPDDAITPEMPTLQTVKRCSPSSRTTTHILKLTVIVQDCFPASTLQIQSQCGENLKLDFNTNFEELALLRPLQLCSPRENIIHQILQLRPSKSTVRKFACKPIQVGSNTLSVIVHLHNLLLTTHKSCPRGYMSQSRRVRNYFRSSCQGQLTSHSKVENISMICFFLC